MMYYNRQGEPITQQEWTDSLKTQRRVLETHIPGYWISTVWLGLDHAFGMGAPVIFETMVFPSDGQSVTDWGELDFRRYHTEEEARAGHQQMVAKWEEKQ